MGFAYLPRCLSARPAPSALIPPRDSGEGGPRVTAVGGASAASLASMVTPPPQDFVWSPSPVCTGEDKQNPFSRRAVRPRLANNHDNTTLLDSPPAHRMIPKSGVRFSDKIMRREEGGGAPKGACRPLSAPHWQTSPSDNARARKRAKPGRARLPALRRGTRQSGRSRLTQLQNHVSWNGAEAGVLPASRLSSPAGSPQTGPFAGQVVSRSRPGADWQFRARGPLSPHYQECPHDGVPRWARFTKCTRNGDGCQARCRGVGDRRTDCVSPFGVVC